MPSVASLTHTRSTGPSGPSARGKLRTGLILAYRSNRWRMDTATLRGETLDVEPSFGTFGGLFENRGYAMLSVGGAWTVAARVSVHARVVNALGADYEDVFGYPALGRTLYAGLRVAARR